MKPPSSCTLRWCRKFKAADAALTAELNHLETIVAKLEGRRP